MADCPFCITRRGFVTKAFGTALAAGLSVKVAGKVVAQTQPDPGPQLVSELLARGSTPFSPFVDGPADFYTMKLTFPPGTLVTWHRHPRA